MNARAVCFANSAIAIEWESDLSARLVDFLFGCIPDQQHPPAHITFSLSIEESGEALRLSASQPGESYRGSYGEMALYLMERVTFHLADRSRGGAVFHAACLSWQGKALLLAGASGSGKSSLSAWLTGRGFYWLTDEIAFLPSGSLECQGFSRPLHLKPPADTLFPALLGSGSPGPLPVGAAGWLVPPFVPGDGPQEQSARLHQIIFPHFKPGSPFQFERLSKASAALALANTLVNARNLPDHGFPQLVGLARAVPAYQMTYGSFAPLDQILRTFRDNE